MKRLINKKVMLVSFAIALTNGNIFCPFFERGPVDPLEKYNKEAGKNETNAKEAHDKAQAKLHEEHAREVAAENAAAEKRIAETKAGVQPSDSPQKVSIDKDITDMRNSIERLKLETKHAQENVEIQIKAQKDLQEKNDLLNRRELLSKIDDAANKLEGNSFELETLKTSLKELKGNSENLTADQLSSKIFDMVNKLSSDPEFNAIIKLKETFDTRLRDENTETSNKKATLKNDLDTLEQKNNRTIDRLEKNIESHEGVNRKESNDAAQKREDVKKAEAAKQEAAKVKAQSDAALQAADSAGDAFNNEFSKSEQGSKPKPSEEKNFQGKTPAEVQAGNDRVAKMLADEAREKAEAKAKEAKDKAEADDADEAKEFDIVRTDEARMNKRTKTTFESFTDWLKDLFGVGDIAAAKNAAKTAKSPEDMIESLQKLTAPQQEDVFNAALADMSAEKIGADNSKDVITNLVSVMNKSLPEGDHLVLTTSDPLLGGNKLSFKIVNNADFVRLEGAKMSSGKGQFGEVYEPGAIEKAISNFFKSSKEAVNAKDRNKNLHS